MRPSPLGVSAEPRSLTIAFIEPHLLRFGGIRRVLELANRLVSRGHHVTIYLPEGEHPQCTWMRCDARIAPIEEGLYDPLDVLIFNEETQWYQVHRFTSVRCRIFYALHYAGLYRKAGSWESLRTPVDLQLANSIWTADMIEADTGLRPTVLLGGVNRQHFYPVREKKQYPILCVGDPRPWKGSDTIAEAGRRLGLPVERYAPKNLPQEAMASEYAKAKVFVVGSHFEGFGQPGLEALACGVPLVTTDNGGCREYAFDEETALLVEPLDADAMAQAIWRLHVSAELARHLADNGLKLVEEKFDWDDAAERFEMLVRKHLQEEKEPLPVQPNLRNCGDEPLLSIVVLAWDQLPYTQRCVESIRQHTDVSYELVLVDNGSCPNGVDYARQAGDQVVLNCTNLGFSGGMNKGLDAARGRFVAFVNNDTAFPPEWASPLLEHFNSAQRVGIVTPAVTAAGNLRTVLEAPGEAVEFLAPFEAPPSAVVYLMETATAKELGGWGEEYTIASAEDIDLCFKVWVNDLNIVFDHRVLVDHIAKGTAGSKLDDYESVWAANRKVLLAKWTSEEVHIPRIESCDPAVFSKNVEIARSVAGWMAKYFSARDRLGRRLFSRRILRILRPFARRLAMALYRYRHWSVVRKILSEVRRRPRLYRALGRLRS